MSQLYNEDLQEKDVFNTQSWRIRGHQLCTLLPSSRDSLIPGFSLHKVYCSKYHFGRSRIFKCSPREDRWYVHCPEEGKLSINFWSKENSAVEHLTALGNGDSALVAHDVDQPRNACRMGRLTFLCSRMHKLTPDFATFNHRAISQTLMSAPFIPIGSFGEGASSFFEQRRNAQT